MDTSIPVGGTQIDNLPKTESVQNTDNLVLSRNGEMCRVEAGVLDEERNEIIEDVFSATKEYSAGDYCIYDNVLYKFIEDKEAGSWDGDVVEATTVGVELSELNTKMEYDIEYFAVDNITVSGGSYVSGDINISVDGYRPIGIVGSRLNNASSSGVNNSKCAINRAYIVGSSSKSSDLTTLSYQIINYYSNTAIVLAGFYVLYFKE